MNSGEGLKTTHETFMYLFLLGESDYQSGPGSGVVELSQLSWPWVAAERHVQNHLVFLLQKAERTACVGPAPGRSPLSSGHHSSNCRDVHSKNHGHDGISETQKENPCISHEQRHRKEEHIF